MRREGGQENRGKPVPHPATRCNQATSFIHDRPAPARHEPAPPGLAPAQPLRRHRPRRQGPATPPFLLRRLRHRGGGVIAEHGREHERGPEPGAVGDVGVLRGELGARRGGGAGGAGCVFIDWHWHGLSLRLLACRLTPSPSPLRPCRAHLQNSPTPSSPLRWRGSAARRPSRSPPCWWRRRACASGTSRTASSGCPGRPYSSSWPRPRYIGMDMGREEEEEGKEEKGARTGRDKGGALLSLVWLGGWVRPSITRRSAWHGMSCAAACAAHTHTGVRDPAARGADGAAGPAREGLAQRDHLPGTSTTSNNAMDDARVTKSGKGLACTRPNRGDHPDQPIQPSPDTHTHTGLHRRAALRVQGDGAGRRAALPRPEPAPPQPRRARPPPPPPLRPAPGGGPSPLFLAALSVSRQTDRHEPERHHETRVLFSVLCRAAFDWFVSFPRHVPPPLSPSSPSLRTCTVCRYQRPSTPLHSTQRARTRIHQVRFRTQQEALCRAYANDDLKPSRYARNLRLQILKARHARRCTMHATTPPPHRPSLPHTPFDVTSHTAHHTYIHAYQEKMWRSEALLAEAHAVNPADLLAFLPQLLRRLHVDCLYHVRCVALRCFLGPADEETHAACRITRVCLCLTSTRDPRLTVRPIDATPILTPHAFSLGQLRHGRRAGPRRPAQAAAGRRPSPRQQRQWRGRR